MSSARLMATALLSFCITITFLCILAWRKRIFGASGDLSRAERTLRGDLQFRLRDGNKRRLPGLPFSARFLLDIGIQFIVPFWLLFSLFITTMNRDLRPWLIGLFSAPTAGFFASQTLHGSTCSIPTPMAAGTRHRPLPRSHWPLYTITGAERLFGGEPGVFIRALIRGIPFRSQAAIYVVGSIAP